MTEFRTEGTHTLKAFADSISVMHGTDCQMMVMSMLGDSSGLD